MRRDSNAECIDTETDLHSTLHKSSSSLVPTEKDFYLNKVAVQVYFLPTSTQADTRYFSLLKSAATNSQG